MDKLLTVVVPAYNAENYIRNNLDSLCIREVERELEILVIDDGSTDKTGTIADEYANRFPDMVRVVHKENGGHGSGINCGIRMASGRWFKVVDADDWVERKAFCSLLAFLGEIDTDAVMSGYLWAFDDGRQEETHFKRKAEFQEPFPGVEYKKIYSFDDIAEKLYLKMHGLTVKTALLRENRIKIDEKCFYVDTEYILYPIPHIKTIAFLPDFVYQYRIGREGQSVDPAKMRLLQHDFDRVFNSLLKFYEACCNGKFCCTEAKRNYIASVIARVAAGKIKILLSCPICAARKRELKAFDRLLKISYPKIYDSNRNRAVALLRASRFFLYPAAALALRIRNHVKK